ncbi:MAG: hypothetical protein AAF492_22275, partial [Verrucomicrobiota bacterium]
GPGSPLVIRTPGGDSVRLIAYEAIRDVHFPNPEQHAALMPTLIWRVEAERAGPSQVRMAYRVNGLAWSGAYEFILADGGSRADLNGRLALENHSGGDFKNARVRLIRSEKGSKPALFGEPGAWPGGREEAPSDLRYSYGSETMTFERLVVGHTPLQTYDLKEPLSLRAGDEKYVRWCAADDLAVKTFHVYDGVKADRVARNLKSDWSFGTQYRTTVETHVEFENSEESGLGLPLPPGRVRLYRMGEEEALDLMGEAGLAATDVGESVHFRLGPSRGLKGKRERVGYREVKPFHEFEETFRILLENDSEQEAEIRVVEHLYRWHEFEIIKADAEFQSTGEQTIEFNVVLKAEGRREVNYTVRYRW